MLDILGSTRGELLVVGYWIAAEPDPDGIIRQIVEKMAEAARRGARVRAVLDRTARPVGGSNRDLFLSLWPTDVEVPLLLTWRTPEDDVHLKLHAKVIVADRRDALVTSANLTMHAMDLNMEMGVRVLGPPAQSIANHFDLLISNGVIEPFEVEAAL